MRPQPTGSGVGFRHLRFEKSPWTVPINSLLITSDSVAEAPNIVITVFITIIAKICCYVPTWQILNPYNNSTKEFLLLFPFYRGENYRWGSGWLSCPRYFFSWCRSQEFVLLQSAALHHHTKIHSVSLTGNVLGMPTCWEHLKLAHV